MTAPVSASREERVAAIGTCARNALDMADLVVLLQALGLDGSAAEVVEGLRAEVAVEPAKPVALAAQVVELDEGWATAAELADELEVARRALAALERAG